VKRGPLGFGLKADFAVVDRHCGYFPQSGKRWRAQSIIEALLHVVVIGIEFQGGAKLDRGLPLLGVRQERLAPLRVLKDQLRFGDFACGKELRILRNQPRGFVELSEGFRKALVILQLQPASVGVVRFLEIVLGGNAVDAAWDAVSAGDGLSVDSGSVPAKYRNERHCRQKTDRRNRPQVAHSLDFTLLLASRRTLMVPGTFGSNGIRDGGDSILRTTDCRFLAGIRTQLSINRSMPRALPVFSSQSMTTAQRRTSPVAGSKRTGMPLRNLLTTSSFFTPITPS
jgi:hypothetical protein